MMQEVGIGISKIIHSYHRYNWIHTFIALTPPVIICVKFEKKNLVKTHEHRNRYFVTFLSVFIITKVRFKSNFWFSIKLKLHQFHILCNFPQLRQVLAVLTAWCPQSWLCRFLDHLTFFDYPISWTFEHVVAASNT